MRENVDQKNSEYGHFSRRVTEAEFFFKKKLFTKKLWKITNTKKQPKKLITSPTYYLFAKIFQFT